jgi:trehalose 6-phosphate phosphatase
MNHPTILQDPELRDLVAQAPHLLFSLDFDGTLAPIVDRPDQAVLPGATGEILRELHDDPSVTISIVSGRSLADVKARVGIRGLIYSGNHGLEIEGPGIRFVHPHALALRDRLRCIVQELANAASVLDGVEIEWKQLTASLHYRRASAFTRRELLEILRESHLANERRFIVREGKKVYDIRPRVLWSKGDAVRLIQQRLNLREAVVILAGDDSTDEDAFSAFGDAITICIAPRQETCARYALESCEELCDLLAGIAELRTEAVPLPVRITRGISPNGTNRTHVGPR